MRPRISVLLPVRNGASTIERAVRSTLAALPDDAELLVHDDGSVDPTPTLLARIDDSRLRITHGESGGVASALNRMLAEARGELVARMDADDVTLPGRFKRQIAAMSRGADFVFAGHIRFGDSLSSFRQKRPWHLSAPTVRVWLALENPLLHPAMLGRTDLIRSVGGYRAGPAEDYDLWMRLVAGGAKIERLVVPGIAYRMHEGQITMGRSYLAKLLGDPALADAHRRLTESLGWRGEPVLPLLWRPVIDPELRSRKDAFWALLTEASRALTAFEGRLLRRALTRTYPGSDAAGWTADPEEPDV